MQWDWLSVSKTSASNLLTTIVPKRKAKDLVKASTRWYKKSAPLRHSDKWSTCLYEKLANDGHTCMHPSSTRYFDGLVYRRSWPTTDVCIRHQQSTPTRWGLALIQCIRIMTRWLNGLEIINSIPLCLPRPHRNNSRPRWFYGLGTIRWRDDTSRRSRYDTTRGLRIGSATWWCNGWMMTRCQRKLRCR